MNQPEQPISESIVPNRRFAECTDSSKLLLAILAEEKSRFRIVR